MRRESKRKASKRKSQDTDKSPKENLPEANLELKHETVDKPNSNSVDRVKKIENDTQSNEADSVDNSDALSVRSASMKEESSNESTKKENDEKNDGHDEGSGGGKTLSVPELTKEMDKAKNSSSHDVEEKLETVQDEQVALSNYADEKSIHLEHQEESDRDSLNRQQQQFANDALRIYSSLNQLAIQALLNVKQETDMPLAEKCMQNMLSALNGGYCGVDNDEMRLTNGNLGCLNPNFTLPTTHMVRPPAELSPNTFAKQLRHNDSASMVVCRSNTVKGFMGTPDSASSGPGRGNNAASGQGNGGGTSGLHQFVTRYTIERPEDPSRSGIEICLEGDDISDPIIEVECGGNKGLLYVTKLCQGSKGQSILFNDEWLTPNEFQFISGRETAKDWKRSIRHCGKSLKTLMTKGILLVHPPVCECDYCKGHGPALAEKVVKKRSYVSSHDRQISNPENARSGGSTTPSSTESTTPIPSGLSEPLSLPLHKMTGREGLNSIISQLHNKKAVSGNDVLAGSEEGSLDLTVRPSSRSSPSNINGRKRRREPGLKNFMNNRHEEQFAPMKRRNSNENDCKNPFPVSSEDQTQSDKYERNYTMPNSNPSEILCLTSDSKGTDNSKERCYSNHCPKSENKSNSEYNGICDLSQSSRDYKNQHGRKNLSSVSSPSNPALPDYYGAHRGYRPGMGFNDYALLDAMKRAVAGVYGDRVRTPPSSSLPRRMLSSSPHSARGGFINLGSTSRKSETSSHSSLRDPPMVELTSPHSKMIGSRSFEHYDYGSHRNSYNHHHLSHHKAPVTVLQHSSQYDNPLMPGHRQSAPDTPHTHHYYAMPPPHHSFHSDRRVNSRSHSDRNKRNSSMAANRFDKKYRQGKSGNRKSASVGTSTYAHSDVGLLNGREHRMVDLHNHAIPMVSLTYTKKRASKKSDEKDVESRTCNGTRNTDSSPPALNTKHRALRAVASDDEISRSGDMLRRLSSSAPPPPRFFNVNGDGDGKVDENNNFRESRSAKEAKDDVFRYNRPRAKSASPNASRSHPYFDGSRGQRSTSSLDAFCQSSENSCYPDSPFDNVASVQQQYEMLRWRDFSSAIEAMGEWSVDGVCEFLHKIGCQQYEETFRENGIDGDALPLLMEHHLVNKMGLKLGHALKVIARVHRRLGNHCALISDRFSLLRSPVSNYRNSTNSALMDSPNIFSQMNGIQEQDEKEES